MPDVRLMTQADPFAPDTQRFVVCKFSVDRRDHVVLSNHASRAAAAKWLRDYQQARLQVLSRVDIHTGHTDPHSTERPAIVDRKPRLPRRALQQRDTVRG